MNSARALPLAAAATALLFGTGSAPARVWISEFMAANTSGLLDQDRDTEDWIELYNDADQAVNLAGWSLTDDDEEPRKWILPDIDLGAGEYLVIFASGENRRIPGEELHTNFSLRSSGEYLGLIREDGETVEHDYSPAYPGQFDDVSFGLSDTGVPTTNVLSQAAPGVAGVPASEADFTAEYADWNSSLDGEFSGSTWRAVASGVGYDQNAQLGTWIGAGGDFESEMVNQDGSLFLRLPFTLDDSEGVTAMTLRMRWKDGFVAYLNGSEIASNRAPAASAWDSLATSERGVGENDDWVSFPVDLAGVSLHAGSNLLAIQGFTAAVDSSTMLLLPELEVTGGGQNATPSYHAAATPGAANGSGTADLPPLLTEVTDQVDPPVGGAESPPLVVEARVRPTLNGIQQVSLRSRRMFSPETTVEMLDDGVAPDLVAGDDLYTALIPTSALGRGQMLRWRVEAEDTAGRVSRVPAFPDPLDSDQYFGTVAMDSSLETSRLPIMHTFVQNEGAVNTRSGGRVSVYYLGEFYDNVRMDLHGQSTAGGAFPKKSYDVDFNRGNRFRWKEGEGRVKDINLLTNYADKSKVRNAMGYEFLRRCGTPYHFAFPVRVQRNARFYSVSDMVEDGDERYLERVGLDENGALYKMYDRMENASRASKKTRKHESTADLAQLIQRLDPARFNVEARRRSAYDIINIPATVNYLASYTVAGITDAGHKNYYMYRDTEGTQEWQPLPWDVDLSAGRRWTSSAGYFYDTLHWDFWNNNSINRLWDLIHNTPDYREMYLRRVETLRREVLLARGVPESEDWFTQRVKEWNDLLDPEEVALSDADLDFRRWRSWGNNFQCRQASDRILNEWLRNRRNWLWSSARAQGGVRVPAPQPTVPDVTIEEIDVNPGSADQDDEFFILKNREAVSIDLSGWTVSGAVDFVIPPGTVIPAGPGTSVSRYVGILHVARDSRSFRTRTESPRGREYRLVVGGYDGQLSARGETLELRTGSGDLVASKSWAPAPSLAQQFLRVTEMLYHPTDPTIEEETSLPGVTSEDFEWLELTNTGLQPLDLEGVRFTDGIDYVFGAGVTLGPGERLILARNPAAFALRHPGVGVPVLGPYTGLLNNDGERVRLVDASGENVLSFDFNDRWFPLSDGAGHSLVIRDEDTSWDEFGEPESWAASAQAGGSAGFDDSSYLVHFNGWQVAHFNSEERADPMIGTAEANPDGDLYPNWQEYAFGLDPRVADEALFTATTVLDGVETYLGGAVRRRAMASDLSWELQSSSDGQAWEGAPHVEVSVTPHLDGTETWTVREPVTIGAAAPERLVRLRVRFGEGGS